MTLEQRLSDWGWSVALRVDDRDGERLTTLAVAAIAGSRGPALRHSRHATTWKIEASEIFGPGSTIFVKQLEAPSLLARIKNLFRQRRSEHVVAISNALRRDGFVVPEVLATGYHDRSGAEFIATRQLPGHMAPRWLRVVFRHDSQKRREILRALGVEIARLHKAGYIHGDLTPYNVFVTGVDPVTVAFLDHERTWHVAPLTLNRHRARMRNLVQLGRFDMPFVSRTDKLRVLHAYAGSMGLDARRLRRSLAPMLARRMSPAPSPELSPKVMIAEGGRAGGRV